MQTTIGHIWENAAVQSEKILLLNEIAGEYH